MKICLTMPGRFGDILWSLATAKAIAQQHGPVDFAIAARYGPLENLMKVQPYIDQVHVLESWVVQETAPMTPPVPPDSGGVLDQYDRLVHLGYRTWPDEPLPYYTAKQAMLAGVLGKTVVGLIRDPWITVVPWHRSKASVVVGWSDEHFELKVGLTHLLSQIHVVLIAPGTRWSAEYWGHSRYTCAWYEAAQLIDAGEVFLGCCSALHVLACALGKPCVIVEPAEARHHPIFWPYGQDGPRVTLVRGTDGKWTWDARHTRDALLHTLARQRVRGGLTP